MHPSFGGINLEDISAPACFEIEERLKELMPIPVFHDDQHGTAIVTLAGFINACLITKREVSEVKVVLNGAGAAGIACIKLLHSYGVKKENIVICDTQGVCYQGRPKGMNKWKDEFATSREVRTLKEAIVDADVFIGVSGPNLLVAEDVAKMAKDPIIFAMANPVPEIFPEEARKGCPGAIIATGRSDYPNQINNVMCFPFLFRGTLDCGARVINNEMKMAVALALAELAREEVPKEVIRAYNGRQFTFGPDYITPTPFDPRLLYRIPQAVIKAAMASGAATIQISDWVAYNHSLALRTQKTNW